MRYEFRYLDPPSDPDQAPDPDQEFWLSIWWGNRGAGLWILFLRKIYIRGVLTFWLWRYFWHWFPDCQHFLAGLTPRRVSDTRRWWAQTCGLTLTNSERGYLPIMQLPFHPSFQFCDITVLKWLLWEKMSATPPTMGIFHMKVTSSFRVFMLWKRYFV